MYLEIEYSSRIWGLGVNLDIATQFTPMGE